MNRRSFLKWSGFGVVAAAIGGLGMREAQAGNRYYSGPISDHFDGKVFFNPGGEEPRGFTDLMLMPPPFLPPMAFIMSAIWRCIFRSL